MEERLAQEIRRRMVQEKERNAAPKNFPALPDIPMGRYVEPDLYKLEIDGVWRKTWLYAAHASEFKQIGNYKLVDLGFTELLLMRAEDGAVRAFLNTCRHRGSPLLIPERVRPVSSHLTVAKGPSEKYGTGGCSKRITCSFHHWQYDNFGKCAHVMDESDFIGLKKEDRGLFPVRCEAAGNFYFVNLDDNAMPLSEYLRPVWPYISQIYEANLVHHYTSATDLDINWKIMVDGTLEFYHGNTVHAPTVGRFLDFDTTCVQLYDYGHCSLTVDYDKKKLGRGKKPEWTKTEWKEGDHVPAGIERIPGINPIWYEAMPSFYLFPNNETALEASTFAFYQIFPIGPRKCRMQLDHFATPWGEGPRPMAYEERMMAFERLNVEDMDNLLPIQESLEWAYRNEKKLSFPLAYRERRIYHVENWIDRMIGPEKIPEHLRVPNLLDEWVER